MIPATTITHNGTHYEYNPSGPDEQIIVGYYPAGPPFFGAPIYVTSQPVGNFNETYSNRLGAGTKLDWRVNNCNRLVVGLEGSTTDLKTTQLTTAWPTARVLGDINEKSLAAFVQDEWKITNKLTSLFSLRYDWSGINGDQVQTSSAGPWNAIENPSVDAFSPRVALNFKAMDDLSFRASWGMSFRAPTLYERFIRSAGPYTGNPNPALDKKTMTAYEIGMFKQFGDKLSFDIAGFLNDYNNLIESVILSNTPLRLFQFRNITKARIWGIETSLNYRPTSEWTLNAAYT